MSDQNYAGPLTGSELDALQGAMLEAQKRAELVPISMPEAMEKLNEGAVLWCVPQGYRGWWIAFNAGHLYEESMGDWNRVKKGASTILGADFFIGGEPPEFQRAHYESESFLAAEQNAAHQQAMLIELHQRTLQLLQVALENQQVRDELLMDQAESIRGTLKQIQINTSQPGEPGG